MIINYNEISNSNFYQSVDGVLLNGNELNLDYKKWGFGLYREKNSIWKEYYYPNSGIEDQGFKIHISSHISCFKETLEVVSSYLFANKIAFKHLACEEFFEINQSKNEDRVRSGKFITIYPSSNQFKKTVLDLFERLKDFKKGPYILSDKRYKDSNIYYRYGAFKKIYKNGVLSIKTPDGNYIEDERVPYYNELPFVIDPFMEENFKIDESTHLDNYEIYDAIKFNNTGGVYFAKNKNLDLDVVLKEARPNVCYDSEKCDAVVRLNREYYFINKLKDIDGVVKPIEIFNAWEHTFLALKRIKGISLNNFLALYYPIDNNKKLMHQYFYKIKRIYTKLKNIVENIHKLGIGIGDLSHNNVMIKGDSEPYVLDFEASGKIDDINQNILTKGYFNKPCEENLARDEFALKMILKFMLYPTSPSYVYNKNLINIQINHILEKYKDILDDEIKNEICNIDYLNALNMNSDLTDITNNLLNSMLDYSGEKEHPFPGEIKSFISDAGKFNFINGKFGVLYSIFQAKTEATPVDFDKYMRDEDFYEIKKLNEFGLLDGKSGISYVLYKFGYEKEALEIIDSINVDFAINKKDFSFKSGLSGLGIGYLNFYKLTSDEKYLDKAIKISKYIIDEYSSGEEIGLFSGDAGVLYFMSILFNITKDKDVYKFIKSLAMFISNNLFVHKGLIGAILNNKVSPYIKDGAMGILLALKKYKEVTKNSVGTINIEKEIKKYKDYDLFLDVGLYQGLLSKVISYTLFFDDKDEEKLLNELKCRLVNVDGKLYTPGVFSNKLSFDIFSGSAGIILGLLSIKSKKLDIFPICEGL